MTGPIEGNAEQKSGKSSNVCLGQIAPSLYDDQTRNFSSKFFILTNVTKELKISMGKKYDFSFSISNYKVSDCKKY